MEIKAHDLTNGSHVVVVQLLHDNCSDEGYAIVVNDKGEIYSQELEQLRVYNGLNQFGPHNA